MAQAVNPVKLQPWELIPNRNTIGFSSSFSPQTAPTLPLYRQQSTSPATRPLPEPSEILPVTISNIKGLAASLFLVILKTALSTARRSALGKCGRSQRCERGPAGISKRQRVRARLGRVVWRARSPLPFVADIGGWILRSGRSYRLSHRTQC
jgi:hypothetical protein